jgi:tetratricopeptide (TPR) repeat protein
MRLIYLVFFLNIVLTTSSHCQQTSEDWNNKGNSLIAQSQYDEAIKAYDEAIRLDPGYATAWNNKGIALKKWGKYEEAVRAYDEAIRLDPDYASA